jgi:hypothetical protein
MLPSRLFSIRPWLLLADLCRRKAAYSFTANIRDNLNAGTGERLTARVIEVK